MILTTTLWNAVGSIPLVQCRELKYTIDLLRRRSWIQTWGGVVDYGVHGLPLLYCLSPGAVVHAYVVEGLWGVSTASLTVGPLCLLLSPFTDP